MKINDCNMECLMAFIKGRGFTLSTLADKMGTSKQNLNGKLKSPSYPTLIEISSALDVPLWRLFAPSDIVYTNVDLVAMIKHGNHFWYAGTTDELREIADEIDAIRNNNQSE